MARDEAPWRAGAALAAVLLAAACLSEGWREPLPEPSAAPRSAAESTTEPQDVCCAPGASWAVWAGVPVEPAPRAPEPAPERPRKPPEGGGGGWWELIAGVGGLVTGNPLVWSLAGQFGHLLFGAATSASRRRAASRVHRSSP